MLKDQGLFELEILMKMLKNVYKYIKMIEKQRQDFYRQQPVRLPAKSVAKAKVPSRRKAITAYWISVRYDDSDDERHFHYSLDSYFDCPDNKWRLCCG